MRQSGASVAISGHLLNYRFRLYPTKEQELALEQTLDGCRWLYNYFIDKKMSEYDMNYALTELKEQHLWLCNYHSKMLQKGLQILQLSAERREYTPVEIPMESMKQEATTL